ncbi:MAG: hypothetical protein WAN86_08735 [Hyphomicrobiaceae bacterium]
MTLEWVARSVALSRRGDPDYGERAAIDQLPNLIVGKRHARAAAAAHNAREGGHRG